MIPLSAPPPFLSPTLSSPPPLSSSPPLLLLSSPEQRCSSPEVLPRGGGGGELEEEERLSWGPIGFPSPGRGPWGPREPRESCGGELAMEAESRWSILNDTVGPPQMSTRLRVFRAGRAAPLFCSVVWCCGPGRGSLEALKHNPLRAI